MPHHPERKKAPSHNHQSDQLAVPSNASLSPPPPSHHFPSPILSSTPLSKRSLSSDTALTRIQDTTLHTAASSIRERIPSDSSTAVSHSSYRYEMEDKSINNLEKGAIAPTSFVVPADASADTSAHHRHGPRTDLVFRARSEPSILLATSSAPRFPYEPLTEEQRKLAIMHRNSVNKRSIIPILYFLAASLGKLILGFGVSLAIKGEYANNKTTFGVGLGLAISGLLAVIAAALGFGAAVSMINKRWGVIFKCFSIGGALFISLGYALKQYFVSDDKPIFSIRLSFIPLALGTAMMGISLPNFTAYTELYRGRVVWFPVQHRPLISLLCLSPSMGILFGGWISAEVAHWPTAFNSIVLTFAVALGYAGVAMFWSNHLRNRAELYDVLLSREEETQALERMRRQELDAARNEQPMKQHGTEDMGMVSSPDLTRVPTQESIITTFPHAR